jgi:hypothetical protein
MKPAVLLLSRYCRLILHDEKKGRNKNLISAKETPSSAIFPRPPPLPPAQRNKKLGGEGMKG